jgi:hypothetical protein
VTTTTPTTDVAVVDPAFSDAERYALAAFLAGYRGLTREAYALVLRQFIAWCQEHRLRLFAVRRADIECFGRDLERWGADSVGYYRGTVVGRADDPSRPSTRRCGSYLVSLRRGLGPARSTLTEVSARGRHCRHLVFLPQGMLVVVGGKSTAAVRLHGSPARVKFRRASCRGRALR